MLPIRVDSILVQVVQGHSEKITGTQLCIPCFKSYLMVMQTQVGHVLGVTANESIQPLHS